MLAEKAAEDALGKGIPPTKAISFTS